MFAVWRLFDTYDWAFSARTSIYYVYVETALVLGPFIFLRPRTVFFGQYPGVVWEYPVNG